MMLGRRKAQARSRRSAVRARRAPSSGLFSLSPPPSHLLSSTVAERDGRLQSAAAKGSCGSADASQTARSLRSRSALRALQASLDSISRNIVEGAARFESAPGWSFSLPANYVNVGKRAIDIYEREADADISATLSHAACPEKRLGARTRLRADVADGLSPQTKRDE